ncbi:hypothetical protein AB0P36_19115 [Streptomyces flavidovirens]|uniref:hypothetical protein n=1 Tax=Streptomyces flavidovirens TaxID=67298 RepID=UPI00342C3D3D
MARTPTRRIVLTRQPGADHGGHCAGATARQLAAPLLASRDSDALEGLIKSVLMRFDRRVLRRAHECVRQARADRQAARRD